MRLIRHAKETLPPSGECLPYRPGRSLARFSQRARFRESAPSRHRIFDTAQMRGNLSTPYDFSGIFEFQDRNNARLSGEGANRGQEKKINSPEWD